MAEEKKWLSVPGQFHSISQEVDRLFEEIIHRPWGFTPQAAQWNPSVDLYETSRAFIVEVDLPGVKKEGVTVEVEGQELVLRGERSSERVQQKEKFHYQERISGSFTRRMPLPKSVNKEEIEAEFKDGVLRVILPKTKEKKERA